MKFTVSLPMAHEGLKVCPNWGFGSGVSGKGFLAPGNGKGN